LGLGWKARSEGSGKVPAMSASSQIGLAFIPKYATQYKFSAYRRKLQTIISGIYSHGFSQIFTCTAKQGNNWT
jgi:hypothetical protein